MEIQEGCKVVFKRIFPLLIVCLFIADQISTCSSFAQEVPPTDNSTHDCHAESACQSQLVAIDLFSTIASATANHINTPVNINVDGNIMAVTPDMALTPAQLIATYRVARTGEQSLLLSPYSIAIGGSFIIGSRMANHISELLIPANVTANKVSDLNLVAVNDIINSGIITSSCNLTMTAGSGTGGQTVSILADLTNGACTKQNNGEHRYLV
jgi:hypothetical protein